ncbi:hypothetical protein Celaphus_00011326, partial [Cervus elaphus hippelaphus]
NSAALVPADNLTLQKEVLNSKIKEQKCIGRKQKNHYEIPSEESSKSIIAMTIAANPGEQFNVPDLITGRAGLKARQAANPSRTWNFVEINVSLEVQRFGPWIQCRMIALAARPELLLEELTG